MRRALALLCVLALGCDSKEPERKPAAPHAHTALHGGTLVDFGGEFAHLELVIDQATGKVTAYILDGEAERPIRLEQKTVRIIATTKTQTIVVDLAAVGNPLTGEKPGDTSQFEGQSTPLKDVPEFECELPDITVKGKSFARTTFRFPAGNEK